MSRTCQICEKSSQKGKKITKIWGVKYRSIRHRQPNLRKTMLNVNGTPEQVMVCATCLKSVKNDKYPGYTPVKYQFAEAANDSTEKAESVAKKE